MKLRFKLGNEEDNSFRLTYILKNNTERYLSLWTQDLQNFLYVNKRMKVIFYPTLARVERNIVSWWGGSKPVTHNRTNCYEKLHKRQWRRKRFSDGKVST